MITKALHRLDFQKNESQNFQQVIKVIGVGGGGSNAVNHMIESGFEDVGYVVCNTDQQALQKMDERAHKLQLGIELTKGLGAGTNPEVGRKAALESEDAIRQILSGKAEMVFITAGMGGGTGTGAAPEIARIAKELGLLVVAVVSDPFGFEGNTKIHQALEGIEKLKEHADTVLVIKNQLLQDLYKDLPVRAAYKKADEVLANGVKSIAELITSQGEINCDFADVKMVLQNAGQAMMGSAVATGEKRAIDAITQALESPLLENNKINGAKRILVSIAYSDEKPEYEIKMSDQTLITEFVQGEIQADAEVFKHGYSIDRSLKDGGLRVTIVAAGFGSEGNKNRRIQPKVEPVEEVVIEEVKVEVQRPVAADYTRQMVEYFVNNDYKGQPLNEPSFKRWNLDYKLNKDTNSKPVEKFPLAEMYEGLRRAGLIK